MNHSRRSTLSLLASVLVVIAAGCSGGSQRSEPVVPNSTAAAVATPSSTTVAVTTTSTNTVATTTSTNTVSTNTVSSSTTSTTNPACGELTRGTTEFTLTGGGADHPVRVFVPSAYSGAALPVVVNWHGLGSNGQQQATVTRYEQLAETEGFIVVHPTGIAGVGDDPLSWQLAPSSGGRDDVLFANELLDHLIADWCADANRIYSTGVSNGGFFTARLVCEMADRLAAASSVAGLYHLDSCSPSRPVPYFAYHGTDDTVVPFDGDGESILLGAGSDPALRVFFEYVMPDEFAEFAADAGCDAVSEVSTIGDVIRYDSVGCAGGIPMSFFEITGGGHTWPNWPIAAAVESTFGDTTTAVDATVDSWEMFQRHTLVD